ncbi:hypothetical protein SISSUDRAFT_1026004 [Sistotremastrum suecicum HHB10207 ss-3]|uniref:LysM domain-containing protein n=1 Tax=Sistotremastrum suecicum HHB10207 ss-3 TaxID=1314776 RepID=A0A166A374_9AGAM|nr:hypothetical protein SISSUDRAFT_1026004 [Sistotremastrum suecicum HHB10207 ss-3]
MLRLVWSIVAYAQSGSCSRSYVVKAGDTCDSISAANNASTYQLAIVNSGTIDPSCSNLAIGATICLASPGQDCSQTHVVQTGETCNQLESVFGINSTILWANNPQINEDCTNMYTGEVGLITVIKYSNI